MPPGETPTGQKLRALAQNDEIDAFEVLWLETVESKPEDIDTFMMGVTALETRGRGNRAGLYLSMLVPALIERKLWSQALLALRKMLKLCPKEAGLRENLLTVYREVDGDHPHFENFLELSELQTADDLPKAAKLLETFTAFRVGRYVFHPAGWGTGRITGVDPEARSVTIDFDTKKGHEMAVEMAHKVTTFIEDDDLRAYKLDRMEELMRLVEEDRVEVVRAALRSRKRQTQLRDLRNRLTDGVIDAKAWSRWWQKAKSAIKKAPDVVMAPGTNPTIELRESEGGLAENCLRDLRLITADTKRVKYFRDLLKEEGGPEREAAISAVAGAMVGPEGNARDMALGPRISFAFLLQDAKRSHPDLPVPESLDPREVITDIAKVVSSLGDIPIAAHRNAALLLLQERSDEDWPELFEAVMLRGEPETAETAMNGLITRGHLDRAKRTVTEICDHYREHAAAFAWYAKARIGKKIPDSLPQLPLPVLLEKVLILHSHLQAPTDDTKLAALRKKLARQLVQVIQGRSFAFIKDTFAAADLTESENLATIMRRNRSLSDEVRDRVTAAMFRTRPELARAGTAEEQETTSGGFTPGNALYVTGSSLLAKRAEYEHLVNVLIPENAAEIGRAASYGDLSENAEWSAAVEKQGQLTTLSQEMGDELERARVIDESMFDDTRVSLGSRVTVQGTGDAESKTYTILGPWDVDLERNYISYLSPLGDALINSSVDEIIEIDLPSGLKSFEVKEIANGLKDAEAVLDERNRAKRAEYEQKG